MSGETKRYRWPELTIGETLTGKEDAYNHRREYVLATDYDLLLSQRDRLRDAITDCLTDIRKFGRITNDVEERMRLALSSCASGEKT